MSPKSHCLNHPNVATILTCHVCGKYYCFNCLTEGKLYYYCSNKECQESAQEDMLEQTGSRCDSVMDEKEYYSKTDENTCDAINGDIINTGTKRYDLIEEKGTGIFGLFGAGCGCVFGLVIFIIGHYCPNIN